MDEALLSTLKRLGAAAVGVAIVALNKKLGLNLGPEEVAGISAMVTGYILQSVWHSNKKLAADSKAAAEGTVKTGKDAAEVFNTAPKLLAFALMGAMLLPRAAHAQDDAPTDVPAKPRAVSVTAGYVTEAPGTFLPEPLDIEQARRIVACETERDVLRAKGPPLWVVLVSVAGGLALGAGAVLYLKK